MSDTSAKNYTPRAPEHIPSLTEWIGFSLSFAFALGVVYVTDAYLSYRANSLADRFPATVQLEESQHVPPVAAGSIELWVRHQLDDSGIEDYRVGIPDEASDRGPFVLLCNQDCTHRSDDVRMELAYGVHYDRSGGTDNWDFWFAPFEQGEWIADPTRLLYRINPDQGDHWGLIDGNWTDQNTEFSENKIAGISGLGDTELAGYLHQIVEDQKVQAANRIGAPIDSLTIQSGFADRALLVDPPGWQAIGAWLEDIRADAPDFLSEASSGKTLAQWLGDHVFDLLWFLSALLVGLFYSIRGWWAVGVYGYYWFLDENEKEKLKEG